jgi:spoIIIJ-associated protein
MKNEIIKEGPSVEEAIDLALEELGVQQDVVQFEVLEDPTKRLFGRSDKPARVKVWLKDGFAGEVEDARQIAHEIIDTEDDDAEPTTAEAESGGERDAAETPEEDETAGGEALEEHGAPDRPSEEVLDQVADTGAEAVNELLSHMQIDAAIEEYEGDENEIILDMVGDDLGILIGRHGKTLDALQTIVAALARRKLGWYHPLIVDVEGYRSRRRGKLEQIARNAAEKAAKQERPVRLRPMTAFERKVVHIALRDDSRVTTESEGDEPQRAVVVNPR